jgi:uncharacterized protein YgfB (UPF0149 family)
MKVLSLPNYADMASALGESVVMSHPSQCHGVVCGMLCGGAYDITLIWKKLMANTVAYHSLNKGMLYHLCMVSATQLKAFSFDFKLLLPEDDEELSVCVEALAQWVYGFLAGLKLANISITKHDSEAVSEILSDLTEIAKMDNGRIVTDEDHQAAYFELVEYVRMAIIFIYQDLYKEKIKQRRLS